MSPFRENGFLGEEIKDWIQKHRNNHAAWFSLCGYLNTLGQKALFQMFFKKGEKQKIVGTVLFARIVSNYQGVIILIERGMPYEAQTLLRSMLESLFSLGAVTNNEDFAMNFVDEDEIHRLKLLRKMKQLEPEKMKDFGLSEKEIDKQIEDLSSQIHENQIKKLTTEALSKMADLHDLYLIQYTLLSSTVHSKVRSLNSYIKTDDLGEAIKFVWSPEIENDDIYYILHYATQFMELSLRAINQLFKFDLEKILDEFNQRKDDLLEKN